jgi:hypothetical protein
MSGSPLSCETFGPNNKQTIASLHGGGAGWWMW